MRVTPKNIQGLKHGQVFVFGSNGEGRHAGGAAKLAKERFGAIEGQSYGFQSQSFGINTMDGDQKMAQDVNGFIGEAKRNPGFTFLVTEIGCGIAGYTPEEVAPLFHEAKEIENIHLPESFWQILKNL